MKKILIIEDEKILREMYAEKFKKAGFEVLEANEAEKGLIIAQKQLPDLVLLDILLPRENGISFLKKLKQNGKTSGIKVLAFSNYDSPQARKEAEEFKAEDYLLKANFTPKELVEKVKEYLK